MHSDKQKTLFLIDGSSFLYRAYYGLRPLHTAQGEPVHAVYGFCKMIKKLIDAHAPEHMVLVWDSKGKTTRHEMFPDYKATRQAPPSDLFSQKELILHFADMIGLHQIAQQGIEADDLMYSLAMSWRKEGGNVVLVTSDKDMGQMLQDGIGMFDTFKDAWIDVEKYTANMGFAPTKTPFYFALVGDTSDNIPGVKGVGKKTALELVSQFDSLTDLYNNLDKIEKSRMRMLLETHKADAFLSEKLFLLQTHPIDATAEQLAFNSAQWHKGRAFFEQLAFKSFLKELHAAPAISAHDAANAVSKKGYAFKLVTDEQELKTVISEICARKVFAYDTEGDGLSPLQMNMVGISLCYQEGESFYIPCGHETTEPQLSRELVIKLLKPLFEDETITSIAHHAKFDQLVLRHYGITAKGPVFDTMLATTLVKPDWQKATLKAASQHYLDEVMLTFDQMVTEKKRHHFGQVPLVEAVEYAAADAHQTLKLYPIMKQLLKEHAVESLYYELEIPTMQILCDMEARGIYCDKSILGQIDLLVCKQLEDLHSTIRAFLGTEVSDINLNSPKQVEFLLFDYLKLPRKKKSAKGTGYSTDNEVLVELAKDHPVPGYIAQYRELFKLKSTYIDALPTYINPETGRIHTTYSQNRVTTGRLSSSDPNLQNIPVEGFGGAVRQAFQSEPGRVFLSADYSQIELRVLAHLSQEEALIAAFLLGHDIHAQTASGLFEVPLDHVTKHQRTVGKRINFSILYGLTPFGLAKDLGIAQKDAKKYIDAYFEHYPRVRAWMDGVIAQAQQDGFVTTLYGRKRDVAIINEKNRNLAELGKRIAVNTVAQGTAAELMKCGMIKVAQALKSSDVDAHMLLQIHDEILLSVAQEDLEKTRVIVKRELESVVSWRVPLVVDTASGSNWKELE